MNVAVALCVAGFVSFLMLISIIADDGGDDDSGGPRSAVDQATQPPGLLRVGDGARVVGSVWLVDEPLITHEPASAVTVLSQALRRTRGLADADPTLRVARGPTLLPNHAPTSVLGFAPRWEHAGVDVGDVTSFLRTGGLLPLAVLASTRAQLNATLTSLLGVRGVHREVVTVLQHGDDVAVAAVVAAHRLRRVVNDAPTVHAPTSRTAADKGAERIAQHYKFALSHMFAVITEVRWRRVHRPGVAVEGVWQGTAGESGNAVGNVLRVLLPRGRLRVALRRLVRPWAVLCFVTGACGHCRGGRPAVFTGLLRVLRRDGTGAGASDSLHVSAVSESLWRVPIGGHAVFPAMLSPSFHCFPSIIGPCRQRVGFAPTVCPGDCYPG